MRTTQYTIRGVEPAVDAELRHMARVSRRSLNVVALEALRAGAGLQAKRSPDPSLDDLFGSLPTGEATLLEQASRESRVLHPKEHL